MTPFRGAIRVISRSQSHLIRPAPIAHSLRLQRPQPALSFVPVRGYASSAGLNQDDIAKRIMDVIKDFEKVNAAKVRPFALEATPHFIPSSPLAKLDSEAVENDRELS